MLDHLKPLWNARVAFRSDDLEWTRFIQRNILAPLRRGRRRRLAIAELEAMTDHQLADIGISRAEIPEVVDGLISRGARAASPQTPAAAAEEPRDQQLRAAA